MPFGFLLLEKGLYIVVHYESFVKTKVDRILNGKKGELYNG